MTPNRVATSWHNIAAIGVPPSFAAKTFIWEATSIHSHCHRGGLTHENCPRNTLGASRKNAREMVTVVRHGKWAVDDVSGRGHHQVRQGVGDAAEEQHGPESGAGGRGDRLVA